MLHILRNIFKPANIIINVLINFTTRLLQTCPVSLMAIWVLNRSLKCKYKQKASGTSFQRRVLRSPKKSGANNVHAGRIVPKEYTRSVSLGMEVELAHGLGAYTVYFSIHFFGQHKNYYCCYRIL